MTLVCSYCRKTIVEDRDRDPGLVSHGMCTPCAEHFERLWNGMSLAEYLDRFETPVLVVDGDGRVVASNAALAKLVGGDDPHPSPARLGGLMGGEAMECVHSRLPGGCGQTVHCRECTIRMTVTSVAETGTPALRVPAYLQTARGRLELRVSVRRMDRLVEVIVEERKPVEQPPALA
jgi:transcriptional regulator of aromatic amino acid metabolism